MVVSEVVESARKNFDLRKKLSGREVICIVDEIYKSFYPIAECRRRTELAKCLGRGKDNKEWWQYVEELKSCVPLAHKWPDEVFEVIPRGSDELNGDVLIGECPYQITQTGDGMRLKAIFNNFDNTGHSDVGKHIDVPNTMYGDVESLGVSSNQLLQGVVGKVVDAIERKSGLEYKDGVGLLIYCNDEYSGFLDATFRESVEEQDNLVSALKQECEECKFDKVLVVTSHAIVFEKNVFTKK